MTEEELKQQNYYQNWVEILVPRLREDEAWADMFRATSKVFAENIYRFVEDLRLIRNPERQSKDINIQQAEFLGFRYKSDIFSKEEYANLVRFLNTYNKKAKGTLDFISFVGWIKNAKFKAYQLWAKGKKNYSDDPTQEDPFEREGPVVLNNSKIHGTGRKEWYPTSHVDLEYDARAYDIDERDVWYLFYKCAPIQLVMRSIAAVFTADPYELHLGTAIDNYYRVKNCAPCIYEYIAPLNLLPAHTYEQAHNCSYFNGFSYMQGSVATYAPLINFDSQYLGSELSPMKFVRNSQATVLRPNSQRETIVPNNYPRMAYMRESSEHHNEGLGLLIEPTRTNLLTYSDKVRFVNVELNPTTYTFSCYLASVIIRNETDNQVIGTVKDSDLTFTLTGGKKTISISPTELVRDWYWFQLEEGPDKSTYIPSGSRPAIRSPELSTYENFVLPKKECTIKMEVSTDKISYSCVLLRASMNTYSYLEVLKIGNVMEFSIYSNQERTHFYSTPYTGKFFLAIKSNKIKFNDFVATFDKDNAPVPKFLSLGQVNGLNSINGYIKSFYMYPVYFDNFDLVPAWTNL